MHQLDILDRSGELSRLWLVRNPLLGPLIGLIRASYIIMEVVYHQDHQEYQKKTGDIYDFIRHFWWTGCCTGDLFVGTGAGISIPVSKLSGKKTFSSTRVKASGLIGPMRGCAGSWRPIRGQQPPLCHERCHWVTLVSARPGDIKDGWSRHQQTNQEDI